MTTMSDWFSRHVSGALFVSVLCMYMMLGGLGCDRHWLRDFFRRGEHPKTKVISASDKTSDPTIKANSLSGVVGIAILDSDSNSKPTKKYHPVANIVVRAFQWHPKDGVEEDLEATVIDGVDQAKINAKFGNWHLAGETTTDKKGHYTLEGVLTPGYATFVEVISVCRPTDPMLPTTAIIAAADMVQCKEDYKIESICYGSDIYVDSDDDCPKGIACKLELDDTYQYQSLSKLTKDDRILYAFRQTLTGPIQTYAVPPPATSSNTGNKRGSYGVYDGKSNPVVDIILDNDSKATITPEDWYSRSSYVPIFSGERHKVGTSIVDIINFLNSEILPDSKNNQHLTKGTLIDFHYYPNVKQFCDPRDVADPEYRGGIEYHEDMPTGFNKYDTDVPHYYAALPPYMHLQRCAGYCYPQRFKEFLLNSGLYRLGSNKEFRDLVKESYEDYHADRIDMKKKNCY